MPLVIPTTPVPRSTRGRQCIHQASEDFDVEAAEWDETCTDGELLAAEQRALAAEAGRLETAVTAAGFEPEAFQLARRVLATLTEWAAAPPAGARWPDALLLEGTTGVTVSQCYFSRIDGNAIFLSGYNLSSLTMTSEADGTIIDVFHAISEEDS